MTAASKSWMVPSPDGGTVASTGIVPGPSVQVKHMMPWSADPRGVTILYSLAGCTAKRVWVSLPEQGYNAGTRFRVDAVLVEGVGDIAAGLAALERDATALVIRGRMKPAQARRVDDCPRRCHDLPDDPAPFETAPRRWAALDFDSVPCRGGVDPTDPMLAGGAVRLLLPDWARRASYVAQLTSGAGRKPGLRCDYGPGATEPVADGEWKRLLRDAPVDLALFSAVQPHFTAAPIFADPALDPCIDGRLAVLPGEPELAVPPAPEPRRAEQHDLHL